jgi:D-lactate dehydrogenase (cytochrome)
MRVVGLVRNPIDIVIGNFHAQLLFTSDDDMAKTKELVKGMVKRAIALGGTCTGEHGVGIGKREYLYEELGYGTVELMKTIKKTIDPYNLFNPGKVCCVLIFCETALN